jgi:hypothetical protein
MSHLARGPAQAGIDGKAIAGGHRRLANGMSGCAAEGPA